MTSAARNRTGIFVFGQIFLMAADAGNVRYGSQGVAIVLLDIAVAVTTGAFFSLGIKELFGGGIVFMVAGTAIGVLRFAMAVVLRVVHTDGLPG